MENKVTMVGMQRIEVRGAAAGEHPCFTWQAMSRFAANGVARVWRFLMVHASTNHKELIVQETTALGDRRFVSVIQFEGQRFLIGSSPSSVALLAQLPTAPGRARPRQ